MAKPRQTKRVKLQELFRWKHDLEIKDHTGETVLTVYQRVINDVEAERARLSAVRKSREIRLALRDEETDEYATLMEQMEGYDKETLVSIVMLEGLEKLRDRAEDRARTKFPKHPGEDASMEDVEEYEAAVDAFDEKFSGEMIKILEEMAEEEKEKLRSKPVEELTSLTKKAMENQVCSSISTEILYQYYAFYGTYSDKNCTTKYFADFSDFEELATETRKQLVTGYRTLMLTPDELKN